MNILLATMRVGHSGAGIPSYNQELIRLLSHNNKIWVLGETEETEVEGCEGCFTTFGHSPAEYDYCRRLVEAINRAGYDCIISSGSVFIPVIAPFTTVPIVSVSHFVNGRFAKIAGYNARWQNGFIALSQRGKEFLAKQFKIDDSDRVSVIYNFVNRRDTEDKTETKTKVSPLRIVYPGGTSIEKSVDVVQRLVYRLLASSLDFEFYWLGLDSPVPAHKYTLLGLHSTRELFPVDPRLHITGLLPRNEAEEIISTANVFLLPSRGEGCPMSLLEALRDGCVPVISDAPHGSLDLMRMAGTGVIVPQGSDRDLFETLEKIIDSPDDYEPMYQSTRKFLESQLSPENWGNRMKEAIRKAVGRPKLHEPMTRRNFRRSYRGFRRLERYERLREMVRNGWYRIRMDSAFLKYKTGYYKN